VALPPTLDPIDLRVTRWLARHGVLLTRVSLGLVFFWFGVLKFLPGMSPAEGLASRTITTLTGGQVSPASGLLILAGWETVIGLGLLTGRFLRTILLLMAVQMLGTVLPLVLYPAETFTMVPFAPTLEGQYIIKNVVLVSAAMVVGATVRGGRLVPEQGERA
jgi:uncharacterized membrane protein YphA (DoxX/SURF4 family)